jgi:hypothetical protein
VSRFIRNTSRVASACLLLISAVAFVAVLRPQTAVAAANTTKSIDCNALPPAAEILWLAPDESVDTTIANCDNYDIWDAGWNVTFTGSGASASETLAAGESLHLYDANFDELFAYWLNPVFPETVPLGTKQLVADATIPATALEMNVGADNTGNGEHLLGTQATCGLAATASSLHVYSTIEIDVAIAGLFTFRGITTNPASSYLSPSNPDFPIADPFLALYSSFDPASPDDGLVGCNDDLNDLFGYNDIEMGERIADQSIVEGHLPYFTATLQPGRYTLLLTTWDEIDAASWLTDALGPESVTFEMWGPEGSLCLDSDAACIAARTEVDPSPTTVTTVATVPTDGSVGPEVTPSIAG